MKMFRQTLLLSALAAMSQGVCAADADPGFPAPFDPAALAASGLGAAPVWVFNHLCVPKSTPGLEHATNADFVEAYIFMERMHWTVSLEAQARGDKDLALKELAYVIHSLQDSYWPGRVSRDAEGRIIRFSSCEELGGLQGILHLEHDSPDADERAFRGDLRKQIVQLTASLIGKWKENRPFSEAEALLRNGPVSIAPDYAAEPILKP